MLYIIATPIGNLGDLSPRAVQVLKECDFILAEDTRRTKILADHFEIKTKVYSFPGFEEKKKLQGVIERLKNGEKIALVSDAGMPCISDPGVFLVRACHEEGIAVDVIPGPSAVTAAAALSGLCEEGFIFMGYFPEKKKELTDFLKKAESSKMPLVFFEAPHRLLKTLEECERRYPDALLFLMRELTKKFQECDFGKVSEVAARWKKKEPKGEFVLCLKIPESSAVSLEMEEVLSDVLLLKEGGCQLKAACKILSKHSNYSSQEIYNSFLKLQNS